jgi:hypothetical protein
MSQVQIRPSARISRPSDVKGDRRAQLDGDRERLARQESEFKTARILEYTEAVIAAHRHADGQIDFEKMLQYPSLFMPERAAEEEIAHVGYVTRIRHPRLGSWIAVPEIGPVARATRRPGAVLGMAGAVEVGTLPPASFTASTADDLAAPTPDVGTIGVAGVGRPPVALPTSPQERHCCQD